ncbi:MAG: hypothetical protein CL878_01600 [Dehalococcoidia bacterium]|nr:hypothetical protein [Dehalococcoidia bacterium]
MVITGGIAVGAALWGSAVRSDQAAPTGPPTPVRLRAVATQPTDQQLWQDLAVSLTEQEAAIQLVPEVIQLDGIALSLAAGEPTDLLAAPDSHVTALAATDGLAATADLLRGRNSPTRDRFVGRLFGSLSLEGVLYGLPWRWRGTALLLDVATWQRAEIDLPPDHWRDDRWSLPVMKTAIARLQQMTENTPVSHPFQGGARWSDWLPWLWVNGAELWRHGAMSTALAEPAAVDALSRYAQWRTTPQPAAGSAGAIVQVEPTWRTVGRALASGRAAARPLPRGARRTTLLRSDAVLLTGGSAQPDAARRAMLDIATGAGQETVAADGAGFPVWRDTLAGRTLWEQWRETPGLVRTLRTFIDTGTYGAVPPYPSRWPEAERILQRELAEALDGHAPLAVAVRSASDALAPLLAASRWP